MVFGGKNLISKGKGQVNSRGKKGWIRKSCGRTNYSHSDRSKRGGRLRKPPVFRSLLGGGGRKE